MSVPKKRMAAPARREHILVKAAEVFAKRGYRMATVSHIVEEAGIGRGTFYIYFNSKKDIFLELIEAYFRGFAEVLEKNHKLLDAAIGEGRKVLRTWRDNMMRVVEYHRDSPYLATIVYREALGRDEDFSARVEELERLARAKLEDELKMMYERGMIRACDLDLVTTIIMGSTVSIIMEQLLKDSDRDAGNLVDMIVEYHVRALIPDEGDIVRAVNAALAAD
jgi:AcrR family transcriptional regulator